MNRYLPFFRCCGKYLLGCLLGSFLLASGCNSPQPSIGQTLPTPIAVVTKADLLNALDQAGIEVLKMETFAKPLYDVEGENYQIDRDPIIVFETGTEQDQVEISKRLIAGDYSGAEWFSGLPEPRYVWGEGKLILIYPGQEGGVILPLSALLGDPIVGIDSQSEEPFPPSVVAALLWLAQDLEVEPSGINVLRFESVEWPDSCLGLQGPEEDCAQVIVPGWRISLKHGERVYTIRADDVGSELRLESIRPPAEQE
jgi:hypothetical protein